MFEILTYGLRAAKKAGRAALVTILLIKAIIREDGTLRIALVRVFFFDHLRDSISHHGRSPFCDFIGGP